MCTMGMLRERRDGRHSLLFCTKTADTPPTSLTFRKLRTATGTAVLCLQNGWQEGINAGMNEHGLAVMSSYLGFAVPDGKAGTDTRGLANLHALSRHSSAADAAQGLAEFMERYPGAVGGIHFAMDGQGGMAVVEHADKRLALEVVEPNAEEGKQFRVRGNHALLLNSLVVAGRELPSRDLEDRRLRAEAMEESLRTLSADEWLYTLQRLLGSHRHGGEKQHGQICVHRYKNSGARSNDLTPHTTGTAVIFDVLNKRMIYSEGPPCRNRWNTLEF